MLHKELQAINGMTVIITFKPHTHMQCA